MKNRQKRMCKKERTKVESVFSFLTRLWFFALASMLSLDKRVMLNE